MYNNFLILFFRYKAIYAFPFNAKISKMFFIFHLLLIILVSVRLCKALIHYFVSPTMSDGDYSSLLNALEVGKV